MEIIAADATLKKRSRRSEGSISSASWASAARLPAMQAWVTDTVAETERIEKFERDE